MSIYCVQGVLPSFRFVCLALFLGSTSLVSAQGLVGSDGISQIWKVRYGAESIDPNADSDGDGLINRLEAIAGTDPFDAKSAPSISLFTMTTNGAQARIVGELGKRYELQATEAVCGSSTNKWFTETSLVARTNNIVTLTAPAGSPMRFFRVVVSDVDTDGDGLTDWEEYQLGLDPFSPFSNGQLDKNGKPLGDYQYAVNWLKLRNKLASTGGAGLYRPSVVLYVSGGGGGGGGGGTNEGTGLTAQYFTNSSPTYASALNFNPTNLFLTTNDPVIDFQWGPTNSPTLSNMFACVRWTGQVTPLTSERYVFETRTDDGVKLWVNDQLLIDQWQQQGLTSWTNVINLQAGVRYNLKMEYFNYGGSAQAQLFWYSASQARQIIPVTQLYPASGGLDPGDVTSPLYAVGFVGQPFSYTITAANSPNSFDATNLPPGLGFDAGTGVISGVPTLAGDFAVGLTVGNPIGVITNTLNVQVIDTGSAVSRDVWLNIAGTSITNIPLTVAPSSRTTLGTLEGITNFGDNYAERIRGYLTAPVTGNYYFWLTAKDEAELWISNDDEPANRVLRASILGPPAKGKKKIAPIDQSPWLSLQAGQRYYIELLHKAGKGPGDYWSVRWLLDASGTNTTPGPIVPGFVLSPFVDTPASQIPGALYSANMLAQAGIMSSGVGSATLRLSADGSQAVLKFSYGGLTSPVTAQHIHVDTYQGKNSQGQIVFDIDAATAQPDGSYIWNIVPSPPLSSADLVEIIKEGKAYMNVHTVNFPSGEINGHFTLADGTATFTPPPDPPTWTDDHASSNAISRFLQQATFGPNAADMKSVKALGYEAWLKKQFRMPVTSHLRNVYATAQPDSGFSANLTFNTWWQESVTAPDQLRQRVAFALSEIMVISQQGVLGGNGVVLSSYYDLLLNHAFGNFRDLLEAVTLSPAMGLYLDMRGNDKGNMLAGTHPNENYAREIMQLFSIGLNRMWPDGSLVLNSKGEPVPTYNQDVIIGYARVFTGWNYFQTNRLTLPSGQTNKSHKLISRLPTNWYPNSNYTNQMVLVPVHHELGTKQLLDNIVLPAAWNSQADPTSTNFDNYGLQDLEEALDSIFNNSNVGPFICRQLIQRLVTSRPSRDYLYRVVQMFNDNGAGVRGDMKAVISAILLDYEARAASLPDQITYGKQREPLLRATALARAFAGPPPLHAAYHQKGTEVITITTAKPHRLSLGNEVYLTFGGARAPESGYYSSFIVTNSKSINVISDGVSVGTYAQSGTLITVTDSGNELTIGDQIFLSFTSGGAKNGISTVTSASSAGFTVNATDSAARSGKCVFPKWYGTDLTSRTNGLMVTTSGPHGLSVGSKVFVHFKGYPALLDGVFHVTKVISPTRFIIPQQDKIGQYSSVFLVLPMSPVPVRAGSVTLGYSTWQMNTTDDGYNSSLFQTPLNSPTVFNFFSPDYEFPGILASSGLTTPEFQLTSDTSVVMQMNFLAGGIFSNGGNTNGLSSFNSGSGAIVLDLSPWMTPAYTADSGIPSLVDALNTLLLAGQLSPDARQLIVNYVANPQFSYTTPTAREMRDRVRAVVHLLATSPEFTIQR